MRTSYPSCASPEPIHRVLVGEVANAHWLEMVALLCVSFAALLVLASCARDAVATAAPTTPAASAQASIPCPTRDPEAVHQAIDAMPPGQFLVDAYGATAGDGCDDGPAVRAALQAALAAGPGSAVRFGPGRYDIDAPAGASHHLSVRNARGLVIGGQATELVLRTPSAGGLALSEAQHCVIRDLTIDYDPLPFTQGTVTAVSRAAGSFTVKVDPGYPSLSEPWFQSAPNRWGSIRDRATRMIKPAAMDHVFLDAWSEVAPGSFELVPQDAYSTILRQVETGDAFVFVARQGGGAIDIVASEHITVQNLSVYAAPISAVTLYKADGVAIRGLQVAIRPDTERLNSTNADGVHCQQARIGPLVEDCRFAGMSDDGINIYTVPNIVQQQLSDRKLIVTAACTLREGDLVEVWDPVEGRLRAIAPISRLSAWGDLYVVTFDQPISGVRAGPDYRSADHLYNRDACGEGFVIRNNLFQDHRRHGIYIKSGRGLIEGNTIRNVSGLGIVIANEPDWPEGPLSRELIIRNNTIDSVGYPGSYGLHRDGGAIQIKANRLGFGLAAWRGQRSILLEGNRILRWPSLGIYVGGAQDVTLRDNVIEDGDERAIPGVETAVLLEHCDQVLVENLTVRDGRSLRAGIIVGASVEVGGIELSGLRVEAPATVTEVLDLRLSE